MADYRATYDQKVIDAWAQQVARRNRGLGRVHLLLIFAIVLLLALIFMVAKAKLVVAIFILGAVLVATQILDRITLVCPNCKRSPISWMQRGTAEDADFCVHCYYWLKSPYANGKQPQV
jgi:hypothetical protein